MPTSITGNDTTTGRVFAGDGTSVDLNAQVQIRNDSGNNTQLLRSSADSSGPCLNLTKSRGTAASPAEVSSGDELGIIRFRGHDGATWQTAVQIQGVADGTWTDGGDTTDNPGALVISTTADGASTPTERLRVDSLGRVGIGTSSPRSLATIDGGTGAGFTDVLQLNAGAIANNSGPGLSFNINYGSYSTWGDWQTGAIRSAGINTASDYQGYLSFYTNSGASKTSLVERARIDSSGKLVVTANTGQRTAALDTSGDVSLVVSDKGALGSNGGSIIFGFNDGSGRFAAIKGLAISGAGNTIGDLAFSTRNATGDSALTERLRVTNAGRLYLNTTDGSSPTISNTSFADFGGASSNYGLYLQSHNATTVYFNRQADDGTVVDIKQAGVSEGTISVSGTTVSYNGGHLSRWSQIEGTEQHDPALRPEILRGTVLSNVDEMCEWIDPPTEAVLWAEGEELPEGVSVGDEKEPANPGGPQANEQLNRMKVSDIEGDPNVAGVFQGWDDDDDTYTNDFYCAMTGDFIIRIGAGVVVQRGDLLMSAGDGTAKPQGDDIVRSKTVAKVTSTTVSCTYEDGSYCVPCVLMAC